MYLVWVIAIIAIHEPAQWAFRTFAVESFMSPTMSMSPAIVPGDRIFANKTASARTGQKGEIVVFRLPTESAARYLREAPEAERNCLDPESLKRGGTYVKRVVAVAGEYVKFQVFDENRSVDVPPGYVFVMGDNRDQSADSRCWGPVPVANIVGRVEAVWWSKGRDGIRWDRIGVEVK